MLVGPTLLIDLASAAKPKAEQLLEATEIDNNQSESNYQRVDSILRFVLIVLQYIEQTYQIYWYLIGMSVGMFVWNCVGLLVIRGYDSSRVRKV